MKIVNYLIFIERLNKNTITYINNFDNKVVIREELAKRIRRRDYNTNL
jgi:hypothetical protein